MKVLLVMFGFVCVQCALAQNYDESKVPPYVLPELLLTANNLKITNKASWEKTRRNEILRLFEGNVYGRTPLGFERITYSLKNENKAAMGGKAHLKEVQVNVFMKGKYITINVILFVPAKLNGPVPVFLLVNNRDKNNTDPARTVKSEFWPAELLIDSGYACAAFQVGDAAPDDKNTYGNGVLSLYPELFSADNGMKAIGAWAWAASRVMDYFKKDKLLDAKKIVLVGHSRGGKAALWSGAQDKRFAIVISNCSGNSGAALSRRRFGETVSRINSQFPHWFCNNYKKYNDNEDALPVDQHMLIALMAPRPVYIGTASEDLWADPHGSFLALKSAAKAYALYGIDTLAIAKEPGINFPVINSYLGYHLRDGIHNLTIYDWTNYIKFANYHFRERGKAAREAGK